MMLGNRENFRAVDLFLNYEVSDHGRVRNVNTGYILNPGVGSRGYKRVILCQDGKRKRMSVHRIVAEAFLDNPNEYKCVDHIDRNRTNNMLDNLRYASHQMNACNATSQGSVKFAGVSKRKYRQHFYYTACVSDDDGKTRKKQFSCNKLGDTEALRRAKQWRTDQMKLYNHYL